MEGRPTMFNPKIAFLMSVLCLVPVLHAEPAWNLETLLGMGFYATRHKPDTYAGHYGSSYPSLALTFQGEKAMWGRYSDYAIGAQFRQEIDPSGIGGGSRMGRASMTVLPFAKRVLAKKGPFDITALAGLGGQLLATFYSNGGVDEPDPDLPDDEYRYSPVAAAGVSQRMFFYVAGLTSNQTVMVSAHAVSFHLDFGMAIGWRRR
jgi:hypothetical protein